MTRDGAWGRPPASDYRTRHSLLVDALREQELMACNTYNATPPFTVRIPRGVGKTSAGGNEIDYRMASRTVVGRAAVSFRRVAECFDLTTNQFGIISRSASRSLAVGGPRVSRVCSQTPPKTSSSTVSCCREHLVKHFTDERAWYDIGQGVEQHRRKRLDSKIQHGELPQGSS